MRISAITLYALMASSQAIRLSKKDDAPAPAAPADAKAAPAAPADAKAAPADAKAAPADAKAADAKAAPADAKAAPADAKDAKTDPKDAPADAKDAKADPKAAAADAKKKAEAPGDGETKAVSDAVWPKENIHNEPAISDQVGGTIQSNPGVAVSIHNPNSPSSAGPPNQTGTTIKQYGPQSSGEPIVADAKDAKADDKKADAKADDKKADAKADDKKADAKDADAKADAPADAKAADAAPAKADAKADAAAPAKAEAAPAKAALIQLEDPCEPALDVSQKQMDIELDAFSRNFDRTRYNQARIIYDELLKQGKKPRVAIHTWELYDNAFSFPRVRRYDLVQHHMDLVQHFEDNLNENFTNGQHVSNFIQVAKAAQDALNAKYHNGEFADPAAFDPEADHPVTWSNVKL